MGRSYLIDMKAGMPLPPDVLCMSVRRPFSFPSPPFLGRCSHSRLQVGQEIVTVTGLPDDRALHPLLRAIWISK